MARAKKLSMQAILELAIEEYRRSIFFAEVDAAYATLRADPEGWSKVQLEREAWQGMTDGLTDGQTREEAASVPRKSKT
jgi:hypothetical protein